VTNILALWSRVGWETTNWSEGFASWCDKESRKRTYVSDVHVLKLLDLFGDGDSAAAGGSLYGREAIEFVDDDQRGRGRARVVECAAGCQAPMTTVGV